MKQRRRFQEKEEIEIIKLQTKAKESPTLKNWRYKEGRDILGKKYVPLENEMELLSIQHELRTKNLRIQVLTEKYNNLKKKIAEMVFNHKNLMSQLKYLNKQKDDHEAEIILLTRTIETTKQENTKMSDLELENEQLKNQINTLEVIKLRLEKMLSSEKQIVETEMEDKYLRQLKKIRKEKLEVDKENREMKQKIEELEDMLKVTKKKYKDANKKIGNLENQLSELQKELQSTEKFDILKIEHEKLNNDFDKLKDENKDLNDKNKSQEDEIGKLNKEKEDLKKQIEIIQKKLQNSNSKKDEEKEIIEPKIDPKEEEKEEKIEEQFNSESNRLQFKEETVDLDFSIKSIILEKDMFPYSHFLPIFLTLEFFNKDISFSDLIPTQTNDKEFNKDISFINKFTITLNDFFVYYIMNKFVKVKIFVTSDGQHREIGSSSIALKEFLEKDKIQTKVVINDSQNNALGKLGVVLKINNTIKDVVINFEEVSKFLKEK